MTSSVTIKYNTNYKNISSRKSYIYSQFMKNINIENENFFKLQSNNINQKRKKKDISNNKKI